MAIIPIDTTTWSPFPFGIVTINSGVPTSESDFDFEDGVHFDFEDESNFEFE